MAGPTAARLEAAGAGPKESGRGGFRLKGSGVWVAKEGAVVAAASMALPADALPESREWTPELRRAFPPEDESARRGPAWADAAARRVACLQPEPPASSVRRATLPEQLVLCPLLRAQRTPRPADAWEARSALRASAARWASPRRRSWSLSGQGARPARTSPRASRLSPFRARMCRHRNSAAISRRCRRRSNWNGSTPR